MSGRGKTDQTTRAASCLVALLFSLAVIAQWAAAAPAPVRYAVMLILRRAEAIAYAHIYWKLYDCGLTLQWALPDQCRVYSDPEDAMMLGWWFRILAVALRDLPRRAFFQRARSGGNSDTSPSRGEVALPAREGVMAPRVNAVGGWGRQRQRGPPLLSYLR